MAVVTVSVFILLYQYTRIFIIFFFNDRQKLRLLKQNRK